MSCVSHGSAGKTHYTVKRGKRGDARYSHRGNECSTVLFRVLGKAQKLQAEGEIQYGGWVRVACCAVNTGASCSVTLFLCQHRAARPQKKTHMHTHTQMIPHFDISLLPTFAWHLPRMCVTFSSLDGADRTVVFPLNSSWLDAQWKLMEVT